jgi:putative transposase
MELYRKNTHSVFDLKYHIVFITKYRKPILNQKRGMRVRELTREICREHNITIIRGHVSKDHVHLFLSIPPQLSVSKVVQYIKGKTSRKLMQEDKIISKTYWGQHFWAGGYFAVTSGVVSDEAIMHYIEHQDDDEHERDSFSIGTF